MRSLLKSPALSSAVLACGLFAALAAQLPSPAAARTPLPEPVPSAPSQPASRPTPQPKLGPSPTVKAVQAATMPGELRPEKPIVPQIAIPLRRGDAGPLAAGAAAAKPAGGVIDDDIARCLAHKRAAERAACREDLPRQRG